MTAPVSLARRYVRACEKNDLGLRTRLAAELYDQPHQPDPRHDDPALLGKAAQWYARRGIAVFPCQPRGKRPVTAHGLHDASTDLDTIAAWWAARPDANIGAATGITFDVIDLDGHEAVGSLYGEGVALPDEIGHALTARRGGHHIFIRPTGQGNRAGLYPSVDYRGQGGYVILPPSLGANGRRYQWTSALRIEAT